MEDGRKLKFEFRNSITNVNDLHVGEVYMDA